MTQATETQTADASVDQAALDAQLERAGRYASLAREHRGHAVLMPDVAIALAATVAKAVRRQGVRCDVLPPRLSRSVRALRIVMEDQG